MTQSTHTDKRDKSHHDREADRSTGAASASDPPPTHAPTEAELEHFDVLLGAVTARLKLAAEDAHAGALALPPEKALPRLRTTVLECVEALQQLLETQRCAQGLREPPVK